MSQRMTDEEFERMLDNCKTTAGAMMGATNEARRARASEAALAQRLLRHGDVLRTDWRWHSDRCIEMGHDDDCDKDRELLEGAGGIECPECSVTGGLHKPDCGRRE